jgi:transketolase
MRNAFASELTELAAADERVFLLVGDIGNRLFDDFRARFPERFVNCGVAEQNMIGMAAGLAMSGLRPFVYTITPFVTTRVLEQIRVDLCYHDLPVTVVGVGAGLSYAGLGATHHSCEDIAFLRALPGMTVVCPADAHEVRAAVRADLAQDGPLYLRLGKKGEPLVHAAPPALVIGKAIAVRDGTDVCVLATGNIVPTALEAAELLDERGLSARVVSLHTVKPLDDALLSSAFWSHPLVVTVEEHSLIGGMGSAVAEWACDHAGQRARLLRVGTRDEFMHESGGQDHARAWYGLTAESIADRIATAYREAVAAGSGPAGPRARQPAP